MKEPRFFCDRASMCAYTAVSRWRSQQYRASLNMKMLPVISVPQERHVAVGEVLLKRGQREVRRRRRGEGLAPQFLRKVCGVAGGRTRRRSPSPSP